MFGGQGGGRRQGTRGANLRIKLKMDFNEIANGANKKIKVKKHISCALCNGSGAKDKARYKVAKRVVDQDRYGA